MSSIQLNSKQHINNFKLKLEVSEDLEVDSKICNTPAKRHKYQRKIKELTRLSTSHLTICLESAVLNICHIRILIFIELKPGIWGHQFYQACLPFLRKWPFKTGATVIYLHTSVMASCLAIWLKFRWLNRSRFATRNASRMHVHVRIRDLIFDKILFVVFPFFGPYPNG